MSLEISPLRTNNSRPLVEFKKWPCRCVKFNGPDPYWGRGGGGVLHPMSSSGSSTDSLAVAINKALSGPLVPYVRKVEHSETYK